MITYKGSLAPDELLISLDEIDLGISIMALGLRYQDETLVSTYLKRGLDRLLMLV